MFHLLNVKLLNTFKKVQTYRSPMPDRVKPRSEAATTIKYEQTSVSVCIHPCEQTHVERENTHWIQSASMTPGKECFNMNVDVINLCILQTSRDDPYFCWGANEILLSEGWDVNAWNTLKSCLGCESNRVGPSARVWNMQNATMYTSIFQPLPINS